MCVLYLGYTTRMQCVVSGIVPAPQDVQAQISTGISILKSQYSSSAQHVPSLWKALDRSIFYKEIQPKASEYSESAPQRTSIPWLIALICSTLLLQEEVKVPSLWHDFTLFMTTYDLLRSPSTYVNTKRGYRRDFFFVYVQES